MAERFGLGLTVGWLDPERYARLDARLARLPADVRALLRRSVEGGLQEARDWMVRERLSGGPKTGRTTSTRLARRSGNLIRAIVVRVRERADAILGELTIDRRFRARRYALVHEVGAGGSGRLPAIRPVTAKMLTIPLIPEAEGKRARDIPGLFRVVSRAGNILLARRLGNGIEPVFKLQASVTIPARPYFAPTRARFFPRILTRVRAHLHELVASGRAPEGATIAPFGGAA